MLHKDLEIMLSDSLPDADVLIETTDNQHFNAVVVSDIFVDKRPLERQKIVYAIIGRYITEGVVHAFSLKTFTQQEWQEQCGN